jgi:hypothetical protein
MVLRPHLAFGHDDDGPWDDGRWDDGSWSGDEDSSDEDREDRDATLFPRPSPSMADFQESLNPYGQWIETPEYGLVWRPAAADDGFRPYYAGRWAWTNAGWYWVSDEPYGWAVYHYGRWAYMGGLGWAWLPGRVWAPAWVSWRWGQGYAAWCPLGPRGYVYEQPVHFVVVPQTQFLAPVPRHAEPIARAARFLRLPIANAPAAPRGGTSAVPGGVVSAQRPWSQPLGRGAGAASGGVPLGPGAGPWRGRGPRADDRGPRAGPAAAAASAPPVFARLRPAR